MLTWDEASSSRPTGLSANKVVEAMQSMYESFLPRCTLEPVYATVECVYAWLLNWAKQHVQHSKPITRDNENNKAVRFERPRHFFSALKLNMRNAP